MADTVTLTIELSAETRAFIRERIERGEFASENDYISQSAEAMMDDVEALERWSQGAPDAGEDQWIKNVLLPTYDQMHANPSLGIPIEEVQSQLAQRRLLRRQSA